MLGWSPNWSFEETIKETVSWYKASFENADQIIEFTNNQINKFSESFQSVAKN